MDWKILVCLLLAVSLAAVQGKTEMYIFFRFLNCFLLVVQLLLSPNDLVQDTENKTLFRDAVAADNR